MLSEESAAAWHHAATHPTTVLHVVRSLIAMFRLGTIFLRLPASMMLACRHRRLPTNIPSHGGRSCVPTRRHVQTLSWARTANELVLARWTAASERACPWSAQPHFPSPRSTTPLWPRRLFSGRPAMRGEWLPLSVTHLGTGRHLAMRNTTCPLGHTCRGVGLARARDGDGGRRRRPGPRSAEATGAAARSRSCVPCPLFAPKRARAGAHASSSSESSSSRICRACSMPSDERPGA